MMVFDVPGTAGSIRVIYVPAGERSGTGPADPCLAEPTLEFYDLRYRDKRFTANGQYIANYYTSTLFTDPMWQLPRGQGLILHADCDGWTVPARSMDMVRDWVALLTSK